MQHVGGLGHVLLSRHGQEIRKGTKFHEDTPLFLFTSLSPFYKAEAFFRTDIIRKMYFSH